MVVYPDIPGFQLAFKVFGYRDDPFVECMGCFMQRALCFFQAVHIQYHVDDVTHIEYLFVDAAQLAFQCIRIVPAIFVEYPF